MCNIFPAWLPRWLVLVGLSLFHSLLAQVDTVVIDRGVQELDLSPYCEVLVDSLDQWSLATAKRVPFQPLDSVDMPLPLSHRLWARMVVDNQTDSPQEVLLHVGYTDSTVVYWQNSTGRYQASIGAFTPKADRELPYDWSIGAKVDFAPKQVTTLYLLMTEKETSGPNLRPAWVPYADGLVSMYDEVLPASLLISLFLGGLLFTLLYNLIVAASVRSLAYLSYSLYLLCIGLTFYFVGTKELLPTFSPGIQWQDELAQGLFLSASSVFYILFGRHFLQTKVITPRWDYALRGLIMIRSLITVLLLVAFVLTEMMEVVSYMTIAWYAVEAGVMLTYMVRLAMLRSRVAWFFIVGSALVFLGGFMPVFLNSLFGIIANNALIILIAVSLEVIVFSLGLGYKIRKQQQDTLDAQQALNHELQKVNTAFGRFVPHAFLESLGHKSVLDVKLGDQVEKEVTVLFSDIRRYTTLAEGMTPQENFNFLNAYLGRMGPIIQAHHGFVNQYYGDGIMALFLRSPANALRAAMDMQKALATYNMKRVDKGRLPLQVGIGIHTGPLMMGIIGDTLRLEAGVVSDTVNTASRMEGLTKHFGVNLLLSEATMLRLPKPDHAQLRLLGRVIVKGRKQPMPVYQAYGGEPQATQTQLNAMRTPFATAMESYLQADFAQALSQWEAMLEASPDDGPVRHYAQLTRQHLQHGVPDGWDGVEVMMAK